MNFHLNCRFSVSEIFHLAQSFYMENLWSYKVVWPMGLLVFEGTNVSHFAEFFTRYGGPKVWSGDQK